MADIVTSRTFVDGERGITATKLNDIIGGSTIQPAFYTAKPVAGSADPADIALIVKAGAYAQVPISALAGSATQAQIWSTRLNSYNAIGNPSFEVDQKLCGAANSTKGAQIDRWTCGGPGTWAASVQQLSVAGGPLVVPGTSLGITSKLFRVTLTTQASLAAGDVMQITQIVEGPQWRELSKGVHSVSLLCQSSVANLKFCVALISPDATSSLVKLCTLGTVGWTLITLPNLPIWSGGNFSSSPGVAGYTFKICLAAGANFQTTPDAWAAGNFAGTAAQDNFASKPVNSTFDLAFVQHEPGAVCSTLMDKPFTGANGNYEECLRYYQKSWNYATTAGTTTGTGMRSFLAYAATAAAWGDHTFVKPLAKTPTVTLYNHSTGTAGSVQDNGSVNHASAVAANVGDAGFPNITFTTATSAIMPVYFHYVADTGW